MLRHRTTSVCLAGFVAGLLLLSVVDAHEGPQKKKQLVPEKAGLSQAVRAILEDENLTRAEKTQATIFHGEFDQLDEDAVNSPEVLLAKGDVHNDVFSDDATPKMLRARSAFARGEPELVEALLKTTTSMQASLLRGRAFMDLGNPDAAADIFKSARATIDNDFQSLKTAAELTAAAEILVELSTLEGAPAREYKRAMEMFDRAHRQVDRYYWPTLVAEAKLLIDKDNAREAVGALHEALTLNTHAPEIWYQLGRVALDTFDFDSVERAVGHIRSIHDEHVLADILEIELALTQKDPLTAELLVSESIVKHPTHRHLMACSAAASAIRYDNTAMNAQLARFDAVCPGNPLALVVTGKYLSMARQYELGATLLKRAIERQPNWPEPRIELGLLYAQSADEQDCLETLRSVVNLDPFNRRAKNTLKLMEELGVYKRIETDHFIIKYKADIDYALVADMPEFLELIHREVCGTYQYEPKRKTLIEVLPDDRWFAVRITGMPWIWTIGACTGPLIAITPPRLGANQAGSYDWKRVIRHEYTHTVTLEQTRNRIPHWFTEACAVTQELAPREYQTCQILAQALAQDELFDLEGINWGFVRPKRPVDRPLAYAQSHWMYEYLTETFGHDVIIQMLNLCREGTPQAQLIPKATGQDADAFLAGFKKWAALQVQSWGMAPDPPSEIVIKSLAHAGPKMAQKLDELHEKHPNHPDVLRYLAERSIERDGPKDARRWVLRYAAARPVDPWAQEQLAILDASTGRPDRALGALEELDRLDQSVGKHALQLAKLYRSGERFEEAQDAASRFLARQPYSAGGRELAATIALQRQDKRTALHHLEALTTIEPDRARNFTRLAALLHSMDQTEAAKIAARRAVKLDPKSPASRFLD